MDVLILTEKELKDMYYRYLKRKGLFDYIDSILTTEEKEHGLRLDMDTSTPPVIKLKAIVFENQVKIINSIKRFL